MRPSTADLSRQPPLWRWTHLPPPCALPHCPLSRGSPRRSSNLGLLRLLLRAALRRCKLPGSMAYRPPLAPFLLPPSCICPSLVPLPIGRTGLPIDAAHVYRRAMRDRLMSSLRTSNLAPPLYAERFHPTLLLPFPFQSLLNFCLCYSPTPWLSFTGHWYLYLCGVVTRSSSSVHCKPRLCCRGHDLSLHV